MSVHVLSRFLRESESTEGARLVGIVMAFAAGNDGICWLGQVNMMDETRLSERAVRDALRKLEHLAEIQTRHAQRGRRRINVYRLWCSEAPDYDRLPFTVDRPFTGRPADSAGGHDDDDRQNGAATTGSQEPDDRQLDETHLLLKDREKKRDRQVRERRWSVDRRPVSVVDEELAKGLLAAWNLRTSQSLRSRDWLSMFVGRIREHRELTLADHELIMERVLTEPEPWWKGNPSPNIIYGSGAQFERSLMVAAAPAAPDREAQIEERRKAFRKILDRGSK